MSDKIWIGKGLMPQLATETPRQIIGIVGDIRGNGLNNDPAPTMYIPQAQVPDAHQRAQRPPHADEMDCAHARESAVR